MFSFPKKERLNNKKRIESLFSKGKAFLCYPLSIRYVVYEEKTGTISTLIVCSKRYQKHAVKRNYIKRRMREAFRLNSLEIKKYLSEHKIDLDVSFSYVSKEVENYAEIEGKIKQTLSLLQENISSYQSK